MTELNARALVTTDRPARYAKQLVSHLGRRREPQEIEGGHRLTFGPEGEEFGNGEVFAHEEQIELRANAATQDELDKVKDVLGRHLERFGERDELKVEWSA